MILYKYYACNEYTFKSIARNSLWCHSPTMTNDPFESLRIADRKFRKEDLEKLRKIIRTSNLENLKQLERLKDVELTEFLNKRRRKKINEYAFCALSESFDNILMWSHYSANHTGVVIGLEFDNKTVRNDHHFQKVEYLESLGNLDLVKWGKFMKGDDNLMSFILEDYSVKSPHWKYEAEWRIWRKNPCYYTYREDQVKEVYFGINCSNETKIIISKLMPYLSNDFLFKTMEFADNPVRLVW